MKAFIVKNENAMYFECGFSCDNGYFLSLKNKNYFITDSRYTFEAGEIIKNAKVLEGDRRDLLLTVRELLQKHKIKSLAYNNLEWSVGEFERLSKDLKVKFIPSPNFSQKKRIKKTKEELKILKKASKLGAKAFDEFALYVRKHGIGKSEQELHFVAENIFKNHGKLGLSFSPIVAINENAAKPHALPSSKKILKKGDLLLLDAGVIYKRYCSDRTRTAEVHEGFNFSKKQKFSDKEKQEVYDIVLKAQKASIKAVKIGAKASDIDKAGRDVIEKAGYGEYFIHSTGHGVGIDIHELPVVGRRGDEIIEEGMVFSVEPGIYLPNKFGVRIEDVVIATKKGAKVI